MNSQKKKKYLKQQMKNYQDFANWFGPKGWRQSIYLSLKRQTDYTPLVHENSISQIHIFQCNNEKISKNQ